jgi:hypothetical protein
MDRREFVKWSVALGLAAGSKHQQQIPRFARNDKKRKSDSHLWFTVRHSITVTNYTVRVWRVATASPGAGKWIPVERLGRVALTGLARKILREAEIFAAPGGRV